MRIENLAKVEDEVGIALLLNTWSKQSKVILEKAKTMGSAENHLPNCYIIYDRKKSPNAVIFEAAESEWCGVQIFRRDKKGQWQFDKESSKDRWWMQAAEHNQRKMSWDNAQNAANLAKQFSWLNEFNISEQVNRITRHRK